MTDANLDITLDGIMMEHAGTLPSCRCYCEPIISE
jgi:hypothetical protein